MGKCLVASLIVRTFEKSNRGIRRKDDNLYGSQSRFEPQIYKPSLFGVDGFVFMLDSVSGEFKKKKNVTLENIGDLV
jgi:hypothetical protein